MSYDILAGVKRDTKNVSDRPEADPAVGEAPRPSRLGHEPEPEPHLEREIEARLARRLRRTDAAWRAALFGLPPFAAALLRRTEASTAHRAGRGRRAAEAPEGEGCARGDVRRRLGDALRACERAKDGAARARLERRLARCVEALAPSDDVIREIADGLRHQGGQSPAVVRRIEEAERLRMDVLEARNRFVERNLGMVRPMARQFAGRGLALGDLVQEGNLGLLRAAEKFDPERGVRFYTYAIWWVRQALHRAFQRQSRVVSVSLHGHELLVKSRRHEREAEARGEPPHTLEERARRLGATPGWLAELERSDLSSESLDAPLFEDGARELHDVLRAPSPDVDARIDLTRLGRVVAEALGELPERERTIVLRRFGLDGREEETLEAVGRGLGLSAERVRQLEEKALARVRRRVHAHGFFQRPREAEEWTDPA